MRSPFSYVLIVSLVANAVLVGIVVGRLASPPAPQEPTVQMQLERYGPTSDVVNAAWAQLPESDRTQLRKQLRDSWEAMSGERGRLREAGQHVYDAALAEPFDEAKLRDAVAIFQLREKKLQDLAEDILISHIGGMPPEARATAAVGLLTPFNARVQRADNQDRNEGREPFAKLPQSGNSAGASKPSN